MQHYDWEREQVFSGYDPVSDGFAYPSPSGLVPGGAFGLELGDPRSCSCAGVVACDACLSAVIYAAESITANP